MLRLTWYRTSRPTRILSEEELLDELEELEQDDWAGVPSGPLTVEGLDAQRRPFWSAYYRDAGGLEALLSHLRAQRELRDRKIA